MAHNESHFSTFNKWISLKWCVIRMKKVRTCALWCALLGACWVHCWVHVGCIVVVWLNAIIWLSIWIDNNLCWIFCWISLKWCVIGMKKVRTCALWCACGVPWWVLCCAGLCTFDAESSAIGRNAEINQVVKRVVVIFKIIVKIWWLWCGGLHCLCIVGLDCGLHCVGCIMQ